jgi:hypothetical protein
MTKDEMEFMNIEYKINTLISSAQFINLLEKSTLGERRPIDDQADMEGMISNINLIVTAWSGDSLVGIARSMTDFHYACYLSDLEVSYDYQHQHQHQRIGNAVRRLRLARSA